MSVRRKGGNLPQVLVRRLLYFLLPGEVVVVVSSGVVVITHQQKKGKHKKAQPRSILVPFLCKPPIRVAPNKPTECFFFTMRINSAALFAATAVAGSTPFVHAMSESPRFGTEVEAPVAAGSVHRDVYLPQYPEQGTKDPTTGRRVHIVVSGIDADDSTIGSVKINGQEGLNLDMSSSADLTYFDWFRTHTNAGTQDVWISFHSRNTDWFPSSSLPPTSTAAASATVFNVEIADKNGTALTPATFTVACPENGGRGGIDIEYVAFRKNGTEAVVHVNNPTVDGEAATTIVALAFDAIDVSGEVYNRSFCGSMCVCLPVRVLACIDLAVPRLSCCVGCG